MGWFVGWPHDTCPEPSLAPGPLAPAGLSASPPTATLRLKHSYSIQGSSTVEITFDATELKVAGGLQQWLDQLPPLDLPQLPESLRVGSPAFGRKHGGLKAVQWAGEKETTWHNN